MGLGLGLGLELRIRLRWQIKSVSTLIAMASPVFIYFLHHCNPISRAADLQPDISTYGYVTTKN